MIRRFCKWQRVLVHAFLRTVLKPSEDHRMCSTLEGGAFCACGFGNNGVTFDEEMKRILKGQ